MTSIPPNLAKLEVFHMSNEIACNNIKDSTQQGESGAHDNAASNLFSDAYNALFGKPSTADCQTGKAELISTVPQKDPSEASSLTMVSPYPAPVLFVMPKIKW